MAWMKHNPAFLSDQALAHQFVIRHAELDTILSVLRDNDTEVNQHVLITAPRGRGKTMLVRRATLAVQRDPELSQSWLPIVFGEESYSVSTPGEFWLEALLHAADRTGEERWRTAWESLRYERDERFLADAALARLLELSQAHGKRLMLVVENLDQLLDDQFDADSAWTLRKTLQTEPRLMLLGTAVHRFETEQNEERALFEGFRRIELPPLTDAECATLWHAVANAPIPIERAAAIRILTGGSPRLIVLMAEFAQGQTLGTLLQDLTRLIDEHTDYFKHNIESLSPQLRRVFLAVATLWVPATTRQIADEARLSVNVTSMLLKRLIEQGRVTVVTEGRRNRTVQVAERLYNIYHLLRRRGGSEPRVRALVDFIHQFYEPTTVPDVMHRIATEAVALADLQRAPHFELMHQLVTKAADATEQAELLSRIPRTLRDAPDYRAELAHIAREPSVVYELMHRPDGLEWTREAQEMVLAAKVEMEASQTWPGEDVLLVAAALHDEVYSIRLSNTFAHFLRQGALPPGPLQEQVALIGTVTQVFSEAFPLFRDLAPEAPEIVLLSALHKTRLEPGEKHIEHAIRDFDATKCRWTESQASTVAAAIMYNGLEAPCSTLLMELCDRYPASDALRDEIVRHGLVMQEDLTPTGLHAIKSASNPWWSTAREAFAEGTQGADRDVAMLGILADPPPLANWSRSSLIFWVAQVRSDGSGIWPLVQRYQQSSATQHRWSYIATMLAIHLEPSQLPSLLDAAAAHRQTAAPDWWQEFLKWTVRDAPSEVLPPLSDVVLAHTTPDTEYIRAVLQARLGHVNDAVATLVATHREGELATSGESVDLLMRIASTGKAETALDHLRGTTLAEAMQPLFLAFHDLAGQPRPPAAQEVNDIADHVRNRIEHLAQRDDTWTADLSTLPITPPGNASSR